jgi:hypothetical protein
MGDIVDGEPLLSGLSTEKIQLMVVERTNNEVSKLEVSYFGIVMGTIEIDNEGVESWSVQFTK